MKLTKQEFKDGVCNDFFFEGYNVRVRMNDKGDVFFVAKDVAEALGIKWSSHTLDRIPDTWKGVANFTTPGGSQILQVITESAVYKLGFRSNKKQAERFTNWVASEVLPSIRKTGSYSTKQQASVDISGISDPKSAALVKALIDSDKALQEVKKVESKVSVVEGKVQNVETRMDRLNGDNGYRTVLAYQRDNRICIPKGAAKKIGQIASKLCRDMGRPIGRIPDERWGCVNSYPQNILANVFKKYLGFKEVCVPV